MKTIYAAGTAGLVLAIILSGQAIGAGAGKGEAIHDVTKGSHPSFAQLDVDGNGVLSQAEAAGAAGLLDQWNLADRNSDNAIERSEFAAFEAMGPLPPAAPTQAAPETAPGAPAIQPQGLGR